VSTGFDVVRQLGHGRSVKDQKIDDYTLLFSTWGIDVTGKLAEKFYSLFHIFQTRTPRPRMTSQSTKPLIYPTMISTIAKYCRIQNGYPLGPGRRSDNCILCPSRYSIVSCWSIATIPSMESRGPTAFVVSCEIMVIERHLSMTSGERERIILLSAWQCTGHDCLTYMRSRPMATFKYVQHRSPQLSYVHGVAAPESNKARWEKNGVVLEPFF